MRREVKIGFLVLISGVVLYLGFNFLKGKNFFTTDNTYYVIYDNVDGLTVSNTVSLNGFQIGRVDEIRILHDKGDSLLVTMHLESSVKIASKATAFLTDDGLLGGKKIIIQNNGSLENNLDSESYLLAKTDKTLGDVVMDKVDPVLTRVNGTIDNLNDLLDKEAKKSLQNTFISLETTMKNFEKSSVVLNQIMVNNNKKIGAIASNLETLSANLNQTVTQVQPLIANLNTLADSLNDLELKKTLANVDKTITDLNSVVAKIDSGQGTLAQLINEGELHTNLNQTVKDLDSLFVDMKERPKRYVHFSVFGKKDKDEKEEKKEK